MVSPYNTFVFGLSAARQFSSLSGSTKVTSIDSLRARCLSCVIVPP